MLHLLQTAVSPTLRLEQCVKNWHRISCSLREPPRRRGLKIEEIEPK